MSSREQRQITSTNGKKLLIKFTRVGRNDDGSGIWEASIDNYEGVHRFWAGKYIPARRAFNRMMTAGRRGRFDHVQVA